VFALLLLTAACNEDGVQHPSPILDWKRVGVTPTAASAGDTVTVDWDYKNATKLKRQSFKLIRLSLAGLTTEEQALPRAQRAISFPFDGPVTVVITATDTANRQIDAAFDVKLDSDNHFRMGGVTQTHPGFPRLGQRKVGDIIINGVHHANVDPTPFDIEFTHFFGIYEVPDANGAEDGHIDDIPAELLQALPPTREFFGRSFDVRENVVPPFRFRTGSGFPFLDAGFLLTGEGAQFVGVRTRCDAVAFAGKVAYDGIVKRDPKTGLHFRKNVISFEPIFATIDLRSDDAGVLHVADIDLGNANQGLVLRLSRLRRPALRRHHRGELHGDQLPRRRRRADRRHQGEPHRLRRDDLERRGADHGRHPRGLRRHCRHQLAPPLPCRHRRERHQLGTRCPLPLRGPAPLRRGRAVALYDVDLTRPPAGRCHACVAPACLPSSSRRRSPSRVARGPTTSSTPAR